MKTEYDRIPEGTIEEFADRYNLVMKVSERKLPAGDPSRYYASFAKCDVLKDGMLCGQFGNGVTPEEAIKNYTRCIHLERLVIDALRDSRREIDAWRFTIDETTGEKP